MRDPITITFDTPTRYAVMHALADEMNRLSPPRADWHRWYKDDLAHARAAMMDGTITLGTLTWQSVMSGMKQDIVLLQGRTHPHDVATLAVLTHAMDTIKAAVFPK